MNKVILIGRLTADPQMRYTTQGIAFTKFGMAVDRPIKQNQEKQEKQVDFFNVTAFGKQAETIATYYNKGRQIGVCGRIQNNNYTDKNGNTQYAMEIILESFDFIGSSKDQSYQHTPQSQPNTQPQPTQPQPQCTDDYYMISDADIPF